MRRVRTGPTRNQTGATSGISATPLNVPRESEQFYAGHRPAPSIADVRPLRRLPPRIVGSAHISRLPVQNRDQHEAYTSINMPRDLPG